MNDALIVHVATLLWHEYAKADQQLKETTAETDDGSSDWDLFHEVQIVNLTLAKEEAFTFYNEFKDLYTDVIRKAFGI